jgi:Zn-dependent peptidase ImmA (M78 family)
MQKLNITKILDQSFEKDYKALDLSLLFEKKATEYGLSISQARDLLGIEYKSLTPLLKGTSKQPNLINVLKLADFLEIDFNILLTSIVSQQTPENFAKLQDARNASFIAKNFDVERLQKEGFLPKKADSNLIIEKILTFFGFDSIAEYEEFDKKICNVAFSRSKRSFVDKMRRFSINAGFRLFEEIKNPYPYDSKELADLLPKIKPYCQDVENGLFTVCQALFSHGVTIIFQRHLPTTQYRGATFFINNKPCIIITDYMKNYATIWRVLMHELYHVLFDEEQIKKEGYHLTGEVQLTLIDEEAPENFASDFFVDDAEFKYIKPHIKSEVMVNAFAKKIKVHPALIYMKFQVHMATVENKNYWAAFKKNFPNYELAVNRLNPISWKQDNSITEISKSLKVIYEIVEA